MSVSVIVERCTEPAATSTSAETGDPTSSSSEGCIVIVDDSRSSLAQLKRFVSATHLKRCLAFDDPISASSALARLKPGIVLVDYEMPGMDGISFVKWMRGEPALVDTPVIMITSHTDRDMLRAALEAGANDFIRKPVDPFELRPRIQNLLKLSEVRSELRRRADRLASEIVTATEVIREKENEIIFRLARAVEFRDTDTGAHIRRIAIYSALMGRELGLSHHDCEVLERAAPLHDVGKIAVPDSILRKPGALSLEEREQMQHHTTQGYNVLKDSSSRVLQVAADIALAHHERWDGTGYPHGRKGDDIPLVARIVAVADVFDALTTERSYKCAWPIEEARGFMIENSGKQFDPECISAFQRCWPDIKSTWETCRG
jgi:putative two-component system response regulator